MSQDNTQPLSEEARGLFRDALEKLLYDQEGNLREEMFPRVVPSELQEELELHAIDEKHRLISPELLLDKLTVIAGQSYRVFHQLIREMDTETVNGFYEAFDEHFANRSFYTDMLQKNGLTHPKDSNIVHIFSRQKGGKPEAEAGLSIGEQVLRSMDAARIDPKFLEGLRNGDLLTSRTRIRRGTTTPKGVADSKDEGPQER